MRRKSERTATKKTKASPEKKLEKLKRTRSKRNKKQSSSSENESADETSPTREVVTVVEIEKKPPTTPVKEDSPEEAQDQVWQVKTAESSGDTGSGEIKKLKICLTRPPSTPERADRSPRSKRKHSRATSSSDTPSVEGVEEKRKVKHKSKRLTRESKDESDKNNDSQPDEPEAETQPNLDKSDSEVSQSIDTQTVTGSDDTPMSTTNEGETKAIENEQTIKASNNDESQNNVSNVENDVQNNSSDADTTVASPKAEIQEKHDKSEDSLDKSESIDKSEVLELHAEEGKGESFQMIKTDDEVSQEPCKSRDEEAASSGVEVSITADKADKSVTEEGVSGEAEAIKKNNTKDSNKTDVVASTDKVEKRRKRNKSTHSEKGEVEESREASRSKELEHTDATPSTQDETNHNEQAAPFIASRKRRWGARPKLTTQKSITISTDVLKEIIPDVKPVEFEEVIEEKKQHKRVEVAERVERPILPKIVIDNTEHVEQHRKEHDSKDKENVKSRDSNLSSSRKISIVKENDSILARPPSPPRHKQSNILYITNLVRPFTLPQLKNLLQRTGRIVDNGFWIDRIKSKCFVRYETEDQAVETRHALHGVTWPVSNPKSLQVDFSTQDAFDKTKLNEETDTTPVSTIPGTVEDWLREQDLKRERGEVDKPWDKKAATREWDVGKNEKEKEKDLRNIRRDDRQLDKRRHRTPERSPEPAKKFKKKEEEAPAKLLDDLFKKTKTTPCIYWLPLSAETIAVKEEQRRQHMAEHERRLQELRRTHRRH